MITWFALKKRDSVWLVWLYRLRCLGAASYVATGVLGILDEEGFTRHSEGGQSGVEWFVSSLFIAWLVARKWGKQKSAGVLRSGETGQPSDNAPSAEPAPRKNTRGVLGIILLIAFIAAFAAAWYVAREAVIYMRTPSLAQITAMLHDGLVKQTGEMTATLPEVLDEATTLRDVRSRRPYDDLHKRNSFWIPTDKCQTGSRPCDLENMCNIYAQGNA